ncbi:unnamed protein product, partial [Coregonus sp. 'balchen']
KYKDIEPTVKMEEVDGEELVKKFAEEMEGMLGRKMKSVKRLAEAAEDADLYHEFNATLEFDYYNSMLINSVDNDGNAIELGGEFPLEENEHFNKLQVNTLQSDIQVPTNVYNKVEALNDVFVDNFQKDPTLTWQYFGSATGFFRLYPGNVTLTYTHAHDRDRYEHTDMNLTLLSHHRISAHPSALVSPSRKPWSAHPSALVSPPVSPGQPIPSAHLSALVSPSISPGQHICQPCWALGGQKS